MAFYKQDIVDINLNTGSIFRSFLAHSIGFKNDDADRFGIRCFRDGEPVDLSGASCQAVFMAPNGVNIALTSYGTVSGNVAYVTLPPACYVYEGQFCLSIQLVGGGVTSTMRIVDGMVVNTGASGAVAPTASVPTYQEIIAQYDAMVAATSAANLAIAEEFDASKNYPAGKNVINDGALYVLPNGHTAGTTWANTTKVASNLGDQVSELKSALNDLEQYALEKKWTPNDLVNGGWSGRAITYSPKRVCIQKLYDVKAGDILTVANNTDGLYYSFGVYVGSSTSSSGYTGWITALSKEYTLEYTGKLFLQFASGATVETSEDIEPNDITLDIGIISGELLKTVRKNTADIAEITDDVVENTADITEMKSAIEAIATQYEVKRLTFNRYGLSITLGTASSNQNRLHSSMFLAHSGDIISMPSGFKYWIAYYTATADDYIGNSYDQSGGWWSGEHIINYSGLVVVTVKKDDETNFTESECYALNNVPVLFSANATRISDIPFGPGQIESTVGGDIYRLSGEDYYYDNYTNQNTLLTTRWRTEEKITVPAGTTIEVENGYRYYVFIYENGTVTLGGWKTEKTVFSAKKTIRILLDTTSDTKTVYTNWPDLNSIIKIVNDPEVIQLNALQEDVENITNDDFHAEMNDALVSVSGYNTYISGTWQGPVVAKKKNLSFSAITDIHSSNNALARFIEYTNKKKDYLDFCAGLGDFVLRQPSESTSWIDTEIAKSEIPFFYTVGNHDMADTTLSGITQASARTKYFSTIETKGWLQATNFMGNGKCSWAKDFSDYNIRIISLFEYGNSDTIASGAPGSYCRRWMDSDLLQWFADTLYSTPNGYSVIIFLHQMPYAPMTFVEDPFTVTESIAYVKTHWDSQFLNTIDGNPIEEIVNAFKNSTSISKTYNSISYYVTKTATVSKDFSGRSEDGKFIAYFTGHTHASYIFKSQAYPDQITVILPTGSERIFERQYGDMLYDANTINRDNFYCIGVDTDLKKINIMEVGGHVTLDMRERIITSIPYDVS